MSNRLSFEQYEGDIVTWRKKETGSGANGQIKKGGWFGRNIKIQVKSQIEGKVNIKESINFNRGSLVDWLKSCGYAIEKGNWCCGGDDDETIITAFNKEINQRKDRHDKIKANNAILDSISGLEERVKEKDTSAIVPLVTAYLKTYTHSWSPNRSRALELWKQAIENKDYPLVLSIKSAFLECGSQESAYEFICEQADDKKDPVLYREAADMMRRGIGTKANESWAKYYEEKARIIDEVKKAEDFILPLEKKASETKETSDILELIDMCLTYDSKISKMNTPFLPKAREHHDQAVRDRDNTRGRAIREAYIKNGYENTALIGALDAASRLKLGVLYRELADMYRNKIGTEELLETTINRQIKYYERLAEEIKDTA